jgi:hypothetical protein
MKVVSNVVDDSFVKHAPLFGAFFGIVPQIVVFLSLAQFIAS